MMQTDGGRALAKRLHDTMFQAHRGAFARGDELVVFGNDGYEQDEQGRARREVEAIIAWANTLGLAVSDFGTNEDGYSWAIVFRGPAGDELADLAVEAENVLWKAWGGGQAGPIDRLFQNLQMKQAMTAGDEPAPEG